LDQGTLIFDQSIMSYCEGPNCGVIAQHLSKIVVPLSD
jgi:hypothetical protein